HFASVGTALAAVAVLAPGDLSFGLERVGEASFDIGDGERRAKVFSQRDEAVTWLREGETA
ncbi:MAG TPA: hypothetical protein VLA43_18225, partial [Longimicrobiales bacterium]|nr:hypothetical protein [Longimicrobiales bacterium]